MPTQSVHRALQGWLTLAWLLWISALVCWYWMWIIWLSYSFQCSLSVFSPCALFYSSVQSILPVILCGWGWWIALHFWRNHYYLATSKEKYRCFRVKNSNVRLPIMWSHRVVILGKFLWLCTYCRSDGGFIVNQNKEYRTRCTMRVYLYTRTLCSHIYSMYNTLSMAILTIRHALVYIVSILTYNPIIYAYLA